jgi:Mycoplasma protein of unknown function, DUF285
MPPLSFNGDLSTWDVSSVEIMASMFFNDASLDGDLSTWDVLCSPKTPPSTATCRLGTCRALPTWVLCSTMPPPSGVTCVKRYQHELYVQGIFFRWRCIDLGSLQRCRHALYARGRCLLCSMEPSPSTMTLVPGILSLAIRHYQSVTCLQTPNALCKQIHSLWRQLLAHLALVVVLVRCLANCRSSSIDYYRQISPVDFVVYSRHHHHHRPPTSNGTMMRTRTTPVVGDI